MAKIKEQTATYPSRAKTSTQSIIKNPKQATMNMLENLKDDVTLEDIMYELYVLEKIQTAERELDEGKFFTHENVGKKLKKWLE